MFSGTLLLFRWSSRCWQLISDSSAFSKTSLNIWKFTVHLLLKPGLENFEHSLALPFFGIGMKTDLFQSCGHCWVKRPRMEGLGARNAQTEAQESEAWGLDSSPLSQTAGHWLCTKAVEGKRTFPMRPSRLGNRPEKIPHGSLTVSQTLQELQNSVNPETCATSEPTWTHTFLFISARLSITWTQIISTDMFH